VSTPGRNHVRRAAGGASKHETVARAEAYLRAHVGTPVALATVSRLIGVSERGLRNAFYGVRGMSPTRSLRQERLEAVRRALSDPHRPPLTVTGVATDHGFYQLGRFAAAYKEAFGETPSETLRGNTRTRLEPGVQPRG
jgi:transcriptional regulator GlxA family with amidase domain